MSDSMKNMISAESVINDLAPKKFSTLAKVWTGLLMFFFLLGLYFYTRQVQEGLGVSAPAANRAVRQLLQKKIIHERTGYGRNRLFAAEEVVGFVFSEDFFC